LSKKEGGEVDSTSRDGNGTSSVRDTELACLPDDVTADRLKIGRKIEVVTITAEEVFGACGSIRVMIAVSRGARGEVESLLEGFVALSERLFGDLGELADLPETAGNVGLTTGDEDACGDDSLHRFSPEEFFFIGPLVDLLRYIANRLRERETPFTTGVHDTISKN